ncbi:MFS transporter [Bordetella hinzii]|uniref:MFS transporter n=1 Tax=Bordetella hinzii TaxID=103855 RepID=UPI001C015C6D|nr:MFS transporter [Bordetella hinzii]QWF52450.1 MFS transporter [Bordetella hinzii]
MRSVPSKRYHIFLFIMLMALLNYIDRGALSYAAAGITSEYGLNRTQWGSLLGYFGYGYLFGALGGGFMADRFGPRKVWLYAAAGWSILAIATAYAGDFGVLALGGSALLGFATIRILFGLAEGPAYSVVYKSISLWSIPRERGFVVSLALLSTPLGAMLSAPIAIGLQYFFGGWRAMFIVLGVVSLIVLILFIRLFTDRPAQNTYISDAEKQYIRAEQERNPVGQAAAAEDDGGPVPWWQYFKTPALVLNAIACFSFMYVNFLLLTWTPKYLEDQFGFSLSSIWYLAMIPWAGACFTVLLGGRLSDLIVRKTGSLRLGRSLLGASCLLATSIVFYFVSSASSIWQAVGLITLANAINSLANSVYWAIVIDTAPKSRVGSFSGITHAIANLAAIIAPTLTGYLTYQYGYSAMFTAATAATAIGVVAMLFVHPGRRAPKNPSAQSYA